MEDYEDLSWPDGRREVLALVRWPVWVQTSNLGPQQGATQLAHLRRGTAVGSTAGMEPPKANTLSKVLLSVSHWESNEKDVS